MQKYLWLVPVAIVAAIFFRYLTRPVTNLINGNMAHNFSAKTIAGETLQLSDFKGKVIILDFWGSWCGPCRAANPTLVSLYNTYANAPFRQIKGFDIISVGVETDAAKWQKAITQDGLIWKNHVCDFQRFDSPIVKMYGVSAIPTSFLIDENGYVVGINPTKVAIEAFLAKK
jgi:thiol-disulfide isomerase/thioredoxin